MKKYKIVVCDDDERKLTSLKKVLGEDQWGFELIKDKERLKTRVKNDIDISAIFLDLYFENKGDTYKLSFEDIADIKESISPFVNLFIYTRYTNKEISLLIKLWDNNIINYWFDEAEFIDPELAKNAKAKILFYLGLIEDTKDGIWLYHFSDLHFGREFKYVEEAVNKFLPNLITRQLRNNLAKDSEIKIKAPSFCVFSGDLTNTGSLQEFDDFHAFLNKLLLNVNKLSNRTPRYILAPGNHDFNFRLSFPEDFDWELKDGKKQLLEINHKEKNDKEKSEKEQRDIEYFRNIKWRMFQDFFQTVNKEYLVLSNEPKYWIYDLSKRFGIIYFVINSSYLLTFKHSKVLNFGNLIREISENFKVPRDYLGILVIHHPFEDWGNEELRDQLGELLYNDLNIKIIFSGHKHKSKINPIPLSDNRQIIEVRTGSTSVSKNAMGEHELPHYRILKLVKNSNNIWSKLISWTFKFDGKNYKIDPATTKGKFYEEINLK